MKNLLTVKAPCFLLYVSIIFLSGCSRYQYISVNSNLYQNEKKEFISENDTVMIKYTFAGENFPITVTIYNKLLQPLYIDLGRSTVIINNYQATDPFYRDGQISYIAPLSNATITSNPLKDKFISANPQDSSSKASALLTDGKIHLYDESSTPLFFRSILAITTHEDYTSPTFFDYSFWASDIQMTFNSPSSRIYKPSNQFYISKPTGFGKFVKWTGLLTILVLSGLLGTGAGS